MKIPHSFNFLFFLSVPGVLNRDARYWILADIRYTDIFKLILAVTYIFFISLKRKSLPGTMFTLLLTFIVDADIKQDKQHFYHYYFTWGRINHVC